MVEIQYEPYPGDMTEQTDMIAEPATKRVLLAEPRGYCAGVDRAVETVEKALAKHGAPLYVRKEIVHNKHVVESFTDQGVIFVDETDEVPHGANLVFSAHGVSPAVRESALQLELKTFDATCPLVTKVHTEVKRFAREGHLILLVGHDGHAAVEGTAGAAPDVVTLVDGPESVDALDIPVDTEKLIWLSQTTLSVDETMETVRRLKQKYPTLIDPPSDDICYATQNRQVAVKTMAPQCDLVIVVGSQNSSNSVRLVEVALQAGARDAHLVDYAKVRGRHHGRGDVGRVRAGDPRPRGGGPARRPRLRRRLHRPDGAGDHHVLAAPRTAGPQEGLIRAPARR